MFEWVAVIQCNTLWHVFSWYRTRVLCNSYRSEAREVVINCFHGVSPRMEVRGLHKPITWPLSKKLISLFFSTSSPECPCFLGHSSWLSHSAKMYSSKQCMLTEEFKEVTTSWRSPNSSMTFTEKYTVIFRFLQARQSPMICRVYYSRMKPLNLHLTCIDIMPSALAMLHSRTNALLVSGSLFIGTALTQATNSSAVIVSPTQPQTDLVNHLMAF